MMNSILQQRKVLTLSFSGAGHLLPYHLGAAIALKEKDQISKSIVAVSGASSGAIAATIFVNFANVHNIKDYAERFITDGGRAMFHLQQMMLEEESVTIQSTKQSLHIGTTRCSDGSLQLFNFPAGSSYSDDQISRDHLLRCIQASCKIPSHFHPSDVLPSRWPSTYPEDDGIRIDGNSFCDGGIAAPAPPTPIDNNEKGASCRIVVSPIAGSNNDDNTFRISPRDESFKFPIDIKCRGGFAVHPSLQNIKAMQVSAGVSAPAILREWYKRGIDDFERILQTDAK